MKIKTLGMLGTALCLFGAAQLQAQSTTFYATGNEGSTLYTIDSATGAGTAIGDFGYSYTYALAFDTHNTLYGIVDDYGSSSLATINTSTGQASVIGASNVPQMMAMAFASDGTLYAASWGTNELYTLNTVTGAATDIGNLGFGGIMDLAFDSHGTLYGISSGLFTIDTHTGAGTMVSASVGNGCMMGMTIQADQGYVTDYCSSGAGSLYKMSLTDGSVTYVGNSGAYDTMALTYRGVAGGVPEPASWALMVGGFGLAGAAMRRRRNVAPSFG